MMRQIRTLAEKHNPVGIACLGVLCLFGGAQVLQIVAVRRAIFPVDTSLLGLDYQRFYLVSKAILGGQSPYSNPEFMPPPISAILNIPLVLLLDFRTARLVVIALIPLAVMAGAYLSCRAVLPDRQEANSIFVYTAVMALFGFPLYLLMDRGHIDGFVFLLTAGALVFLHPRPTVSSILLSLAISLKVYPILLIIPLAIYRRWQVVMRTCLFCGLLLLVAPGFWWQFLTERILVRAGLFTPISNASLGNAFYYVGRLASLVLLGGKNGHVAESFLAVSFYGYLALLGANILSDLESSSSAGPDKSLVKSILYVPFMLAVPKLAYDYQLVMILALAPAAHWMWKHELKEHAMKGVVVMGMATGFALTQFQVLLYQEMFHSAAPHFLPSFGLLLIILSSTVYKMIDMRMPRTGS